jgi:hypothetical protein
MELAETEKLFLQEWSNPEFNDTLNDIIQCHYSIGNDMTREEANEFEQITALFPLPPPPHKSGRARSHYSIKSVWERIWEFLGGHPTFRAGSVQKILSKFWFVQNGA